MGAILSGALLLISTPADSLAAGRSGNASRAKKGTTRTQQQKTATRSTRKTAANNTNKSASLRRKSRTTRKETNPPTGVVKLRSTKAPTLSSPQRQWSTSWSSGQYDGVTRMAKSVAKKKVGNADQDATVYEGFGDNGTIGQLTFEPLARGRHRVVLGDGEASHVLLPGRKSDGPAKEGERGAVRRRLNAAGTQGRVNTVEFFKAKVGGGGQVRYFAVYGEQGLTVSGKRTEATLTHIVDIAGKKVISLPYNFLSVWNSNGSEALVLVEPLNPDGTVKSAGGEVLGIPLAKLASDFDKTVSDTSEWTKVL